MNNSESATAKKATGDDVAHPTPVLTTQTARSLRGSSGLSAATNPSAESHVASSTLSAWTRKTSPQTCTSGAGLPPVVAKRC